MPAPTDPIHHIALADEWDAALAVGSYRRSTLDQSLDDVGFIHCSTADQVAGTLERHYSDCTRPLVLLTIDPDRLGPTEVRVEGGFPHLYGPLPVAAVTDVEPIG
jgi:glutathione S-transferase